MLLGNTNSQNNIDTNEEIKKVLKKAQSVEVDIIFLITCMSVYLRTINHFVTGRKNCEHQLIVFVLKVYQKALEADMI